MRSVTIKFLVVSAWCSAILKQIKELALIILAEGLNVNAFQGLSLGTRYNTSIEVHPLGHGAKALNDWKDKNSELIYKAIVDKTYLDSLLTLANSIGQRKMCLSALETKYEQIRVLRPTFMAALDSVPIAGCATSSALPVGERRFRSAGKKIDDGIGSI
nr:replication protein A 70 kDa DNA-binding subunit B-like isoform X1 [Ipomoea batatas]